MNIWRWIKRFFGNSAKFLRETRAELKKVVWPTWSQVRVFTVVVVFAMVAIGAILWGTDGLLTLGLQLVMKK